MKKLNLNIQMFASTNKTTNYDLPQFVGTDKPTWLGDFNEAMFDIDAGMHENATDISAMASDVATASAAASQASQDVSALTSTVNTLSTNVSTATTTANNAQSTATSALNTANTANGKADTNAGAISNIQSDINDIEDNISTITDYSTTEKVIGTWVDNKPIYRKVVKFGAMPNTASKDIPHNISNIGITVNCYGMAVRSSDKRALTIPDSIPGGEINCGVTDTNVNVTTHSDRSSFNDSHIIIEYTKTTD